MDNNSKNGQIRQATISCTQQKKDLQNARDQYTNELEVLTNKKAAAITPLSLRSFFANSSLTSINESHFEEVIASGNIKCLF